MSETVNNELNLPDEITNGHKFTFVRKDWIEVKELGKYGFDDEIINGLVKYEVMPAALRYKGKLYVPKFAILKVLHVTLVNAVKMYEMAEKHEQDALEILKQIEKDQELLNAPSEAAVAETVVVDTAEANVVDTTIGG